MAVSKDLVIFQGKTFVQEVRWAKKDVVVYKPITAVQQSAPVRITAALHGLVEGWPAAVTNVKGMTELNPEDPNRVRESNFHPATVLDDNTVEFNDVNAAGFSPYLAGGHIQYNQPVDLTGYTARMAIKDKIGGTVLLTLATPNAGIVIDLAKKLITLRISAADTALITWLSGVYELELVSGDSTPVVTTILVGRVNVTREVTT